MLRLFFFPLWKVLVVITRAISLSQSFGEDCLEKWSFSESTQSLTGCVRSLLWASFSASAKQEQASPARPRGNFSLRESDVVTCANVPWGGSTKHCENVDDICVIAVGWVIWSAMASQWASSRGGNQSKTRGPVWLRFLSLSFFLSFFFFFSFILSHVDDRLLKLQPGIRAVPLRWESQVQDIDPPETSQLHVISNGKNLPEISISTPRPSSTQRPASYSAGYTMPNN